MKLLGDKILVRITKEKWEDLFSKEIIRNDGTKVKLFTNVPAQDEKDERRSKFFVQTGIVEAVSGEVKDVRVGDIAIIDYTLTSSYNNLFYKDDGGDVYWLNATTKYHDKDLVAYQNRRSNRDQIVHVSGDVDELSMLLGVIRGDELIARDPFCFLEHEPVTKIITTMMGIEYTEKEKILRRKILSVSENSTVRYGVKNRDIVIVDDYDIFSVEINGKKIDCVNDADILATAPLIKQAASHFKEMKAV